MRRLFRAYGSNAAKMLGEARFASDLGQTFGTMSEREVEYLRKEEWAQTADDILWRRSKLGLHMKAAEQEKLRQFLQPVARSGRVKKPAVSRRRA